MKIRYSVLVFSVFILLTQLTANTGQQFASLGDYTLENGQVIENCRVGFRTFGMLNSDSSNAVVFPTWFGGKSAHLASLCGAGKLADSTQYFVIAVDALGDGISSSPSTSTTQPNEAFPEFTIRDMVSTQYQLVTQHLNLRKIKAVIGGSMGGMQTFQWVVQYPGFMEKAIPYVGSPRMTSYDLLLWNAELLALEVGHQDEDDLESMLEIVGVIQQMNAYTPDYRVRKTSRSDFPEYFANAKNGVRDNHNSYNWASQLRAMIHHDITNSFGGSLEAAADTVKADLLIIVGAQDHMVNPEPAQEFAKLAKAELLVLDSDCGHMAVNCEMDTVLAQINAFLEH